MKIRSIEPVLLRIPFEAGTSSTGFGGKPWTSFEMLLVRVETDDGIVGWGESWGFAINPATRVTIEQVAAPHFIGRDPTRLDELFREVRHRLHLFGRNGPVNYALSGIEIALWDIRGKRVGQPVHALLGGAHRLEFPAYASLVPYRDPELVGRMTARALGDGYRSVKLHEIDVPQVRAARTAGADFELMVDTNCPWLPWQALEMARRMREFDLLWLEEPVWPPENFPALAHVRRESGVPIAAGENVGTVREFETLLSHEAVSYAQPSVTKIGGITETRKVCELAELHDVPVSLHSPYLGPGLAATLHLSATLPYPARIERVYIQLEASPFGSMIDVRSGTMRVPEGPGLGIEPDPRVLERYRVRD